MGCIMGLGSMGMVFQYAALIFCFGAVIAYIFSYLSKQYNIISIGNILFAATAVSIVFASIILFTACAISDFSIAYVVNYSSSTLPMFYKISAFWGGQAGSLLLWVLLLVIFGSIELYRIKSKDSVYKLGVMLIMSGTTLFFVILVTFLQNPFVATDKLYMDGFGLNPLLQNPGMVIHPPTLYIGYVGFTVIIAHSLSAILTRDFSSDWLKMARPWSMIIWAFLTIGIVIGAWWAYVELGWGGYWAWDPVENASIMPWFTATAFLHSAYIYEKTGKLKVFTFILLLITFELTILGTFITRSGLLDSVHSFAPHPIGYYFIIYIIISSAVYLIVFLSNPKFSELVKNDEEGFKFFSRTGIVFISNWLFIAISVAIIFGTFLPLFSSSSYTITQYNRTTSPFFALIFFASGFGLLTGFKVSNIKTYYKRLIISFAVSVIGVVVMIVLGYTKIWSLILAFTIYFSAAAVIIRIVTSISKIGVVSFFKTNRFAGAMIIHFGLVVIALGVVMSSFYHYEKDFTVQANTALNYGNYTFKVGSYSSIQEENYIAEYVPIEIYDNNKLLATAYPEIRNYNTHSDKFFGEVSYLSLFTGDLYFALKGFEQTGEMVIIFIHQPYVSWIWAGCLIMALGAFLGAFTYKRKDDNISDKKSYLVEEK